MEPTPELSIDLTNTGSGESIQSDKFDETTQVIVHDIRTNRNYVKARHDVESTQLLSNSFGMTDSRLGDDPDPERYIPVR